MRDIINAQIAAKERQITDLHQRIAADQQQIVILDAQVEAFRELLREMPATSLDAPAAGPQQTLQAAVPPAPRVAPGRKKRGLTSETWRDLVGFVGPSRPRDVSLEVLYGVALKLGHPIQQDSVRSSVAGYVNSGYLIRTSPGRFTTTDEGLEKAGITVNDLTALHNKIARIRKGPGAEAPGPSSVTGEAATSPVENREGLGLLG